MFYIIGIAGARGRPCYEEFSEHPHIEGKVKTWQQAQVVQGPKGPQADAVNPA